MLFIEVTILFILANAISSSIAFLYDLSPKSPTFNPLGTNNAHSTNTSTIKNLGILVEKKYSFRKGAENSFPKTDYSRNLPDNEAKKSIPSLSYSSKASTHAVAKTIEAKRSIQETVESSTSSGVDYHANEKDLEDKLERLRSQLINCLEEHSSLLCHIPISFTFNMVFEEVKKLPVSVKKSPKMEMLVKIVSEVINSLEEKRQRLCSSNEGSKNICTEEEMLGLDKTNNPWVGFGIRLQDMSDQISSVVKGTSPLKINFRNLLGFDHLVAEVEVSIKRLSSSFNQLEKIRNEVCEQYPNQEYCLPKTNVEEKSPQLTVENSKDSLTSILKLLELCKEEYLTSPGCYQPLKSSFEEISGNIEESDLQPDEAKNIEKISEHIFELIMDIERKQELKCDREGDKKFCGSEKSSIVPVSYPETSSITSFEYTNSQLPSFQESGIVGSISEPEDENWAETNPYKDNKIGKDGQVRKKIHERLNILRQELSRNVRSHLQGILADLRTTQSGEWVDYDKYFQAKKRFNDIAGKLKGLSIPLHEGSQARDTFDKCTNEIQKIEVISKEKCKKSTSDNDLCLHFSLPSYKAALSEFSETVDFTLRSMLHIKISEQDINQLKMLYEQSKKYYNIGQTYLVEERDSRGFSSKLANIQQNLYDRIMRNMST